ncbi:hypothetical protein QLQ12_29995 [Actinoplanes sp. NEAU-A12]|uniref:Uncharacterized protein n=1 Tax=Actinoplanes sandaracinus TaxID=3045177 RepID=A0ABT6WSY4_9ACTN|nr:hypothetical protein [Actinoplanes sandaracinus]MDI6102858.1 hypothetical protein [Actinoplanes sandaracinus]
MSAAGGGAARLAGFVLNHLGLSGLFSIEFLTHAVPQHQDAAAREAVCSPGRDGRTSWWWL